MTVPLLLKFESAETYIEKTLKTALFGPKMAVLRAFQTYFKSSFSFLSDGYRGPTPAPAKTQK